MHSEATVRIVLGLGESGLHDAEVARRTGVPRSTVRGWRAGAVPRRARDLRCGRCGHEQHRFAELPAEYAYLLGIYLGDGYLARHRRHVYRLVVSLDSRYPGIVAETKASMASVVPRNVVRVAAVQGKRLRVVSAYSKEWPCLFPQHGHGPKHARVIELDPWQREFVARYPELLVRGLIHSDGSRSLNRVVVRGRAYAYPRYTFTNLSSDVREIFCDACDRLGVPWRQMNRRTISVARRAGVARLDAFIGPKR